MNPLLQKIIRASVPAVPTTGAIARFAGRVRRKGFRVHRERKPGYYSQNGQDVFLDESVFRGQEKGVFIDIGANDGVSLSNSYFFENDRGWTGVCVEPQPDKFESLQKARTSLCIQGCVTDTAGTAEFLAVSGDFETRMRTFQADR